MANQKKFSEMVAVVSVIDPDAYTAATYTGDWVEVDDFQKYAALCTVGEMQATSTVDFSIVQATDSSGTGAKAITNCAATQLTAAGTDSDKQVVINMTVDDLDIANGFRFVAPRAVVATAASDAAAMLVGVYPYNGPASDNDLASVDEIVN